MPEDLQLCTRPTSNHADQDTSLSACLSSVRCSSTLHAHQPWHGNLGQGQKERRYERV